MISRAFLSLSAFSLTVVAAAQEDAARKEIDRLQGEWTVQSFEREGMAVSTKKLSLTVSSSEWTARAGDTVEGSGTMTLDPSKSPRAVDSRVMDGPDRGKTLRGIYELRGDDWRFYYSAPGKERPTAFPTQTGTAYLYMVLKRKKIPAP